MAEDRRHDEDGRGDALSDRLPRSVRRRLHRCADEYLRECAEADSFATGGASRRRNRTWPGWCVAAACGVLAVVGWWPRLTAVEPAMATSSFGQWLAHLARDQMLGSSPRVGHWPWDGPAVPPSGDVVWDEQSQRGFIVLRGIQPNDPAHAQYQLWIFDASRDERYPVDGGVFDVPAGHAEVVIPVKAAVRVARPAAFAVTVERPGGTVVSDREHVVAFAHADG